MHTKPYFNKHKILTVHGIIATNALTFMQKFHKFPESIPKAVRDTISNEAPKIGSNHDSCDAWLNNYNNNCFGKSLFYKGPLLSVDQRFNELTTTVSMSYKSFRMRAKLQLLKIQSEGETENWQAENFAINKIAGLRKSQRKRKPIITIDPEDM